MGQSSGSVGPAIGGSPFGGLRVLSPMDIARASPQYDPYTASRRPNYMPYGPNQQFYQPIYQPSYSQFSPMGYGQAPFGGFYQPPMMGFGQRFGNRMFQQPQPMLSPQPIQSQYRPIPYMTQTQLDSRQRAAEAAAAAAMPYSDYGGGGGYGDAGGGDAGGVGMGAGSTGEGVFKKGGGVEEGIDSLLKK